jgi:hypothetical protein
LVEAEQELLFQPAMDAVPHPFLAAPDRAQRRQQEPPPDSILVEPNRFWAKAGDSSEEGEDEASFEKEEDEDALAWWVSVQRLARLAVRE